MDILPHFILMDETSAGSGVGCGTARTSILLLLFLDCLTCQQNAECIRGDGSAETVAHAATLT